MSKSREEEELVRRAAMRDKEAFRELFERYGQRVFAIAYDVVRRKEDAEDVVQESFVKAYLSLPEFRGQSSFYTWLYRIVYNLAIDYRRKTSRRGGETLEYEDSRQSAVTAGASEPPPSPDEAVSRSERAARIRKELDQISEDHRMVIILREVDGLNYEEIADVLKISKGTVMSRLHYARKKLQKALRDLAEEHNIKIGSDDGSESEIGGAASLERKGGPSGTLSAGRNTL